MNFMMGWQNKFFRSSAHTIEFPLQHCKRSNLFPGYGRSEWSHKTRVDVINSLYLLVTVLGREGLWRLASCNISKSWQYFSESVINSFKVVLSGRTLNWFLAPCASASMVPIRSRCFSATCAPRRSTTFSCSKTRSTTPWYNIRFIFVFQV